MEFSPIFMFILVGIVTALGMLGSGLVGPRQTNRVKQMPYESGMDPIGDARQRFDVRYYLVAIMFLLFDVELLYLYPWVVGQWSYIEPGPARTATVGDRIVQVAATSGYPYGIPPEFRTLVFWEIMVFVAVLTAAFAYAWRKGVFTWR